MLTVFLLYFYMQAPDKWMRKLKQYHLPWQKFFFKRLKNRINKNSQELYI